jgi:hypothetical protein
MLANTMVLTLHSRPGYRNDIERGLLAIRQNSETRLGNHVSQNRNMHSKQSQFWQRPSG